MSNMDLIEVETRKLELETSKFELEQRQAKALSVSAFFPDNLKNDVASAVIVYDLAKRMNISVMEVSQSIFIIYGRPSFATTFLVARLNQSGLIKGALRTVVSADKQSAYCTAIDAVSGEELVGMEVTMDMAKKEGWFSKKGSKWQTMPELMLRKRSQSFFIKEYFPEVMFGLQTQEELIDTEAIEATVTSSQEDINKALSMGIPKPKATRMPRYVSKHYKRLENCGVKSKDVREFAEYMDFVGRGEKEVEAFFTQSDSKITFYVNDFYGIEQATEAQYEEVGAPTEESPNENMASQEPMEAPTQESNTQEPKSGVSLARYKGVLIAKGIKPEDFEEFMSWASLTQDNIAQFIADKGAVDALTEEFIKEAGYAKD